MKYQNEETSRMPEKQAVWTLGLLFVAIFFVMLCTYIHYLCLSPLQQWWLSDYIKTSVSVWFGIEGSDTYPILYGDAWDGNQYFLFESKDVELKPDAGPDEIPFQLTKQGHQDYTRIFGRVDEKDKVKLRDLIRKYCFHNQTLGDMAMTSVWCGVAFFIAGLYFTLPRDAARARIRRDGKRVKGPELVTVKEFNRRHDADGLRFLTEEHSYIEQLLRQEPHPLCIPYEREAEHFLMISDPGGGKSTLIKQILVQVEQRGEVAIVYDPALEFTRKFYNPKRGDVILNPLDARSPFWSPSAEVTSEAEADAVAESFYPDEPGEKKFFNAATRKIFAKLLLTKSTPTEILQCLSNEAEIQRLVKGTTLEAVLHPKADQQRAGVLGSLNLAADALKLLPRKQDTTASWTANSWSQERPGWIFITSTAETRKALRPLMSLWLDLLVLHLLNQDNTGKRAWLVLDELASLQHLPQLHTAVTEARKSNNPIVMALHGRSQLEKRYGLDADAILSGPATKFYLRTSEPKSGEWISKAIGDVVLDRVRETENRGVYPEDRQSYSEQIERRQEPLVLPSQISGLDNRHGYVKSRNLVVRFSFPVVDLPDRARPFIPRTASVTSPQNHDSSGESSPRAWRSHDFAS